MKITRRMTLAAFTASPFAMATTAAPACQRQTQVSDLFRDWRNELREGNRLSSMDCEEESGHAFNRALDIQDAIAAAPCQNDSDVWIKLHVALDNFPDAPDDNILLSLKADAMRFIDHSDTA
ncbi:hypothetical protein [Sulfitobacter sp. 1A12779]|uniref:hypothetical protein n=1 Tax=Sulfitobacter sp. 1A12779 TaxID=3368599 RepID=UPI0037478041|tara:strand:+ start:1934 stop:2299 length:366 start_codon:yes stop_codon:yes gene_type:complete